MQLIIPIDVGAETYVQERFHERVRPPLECPNCNETDCLWGHGFYSRYTTGATGKDISIVVKRLICKLCRVTISCLPDFAQPYRLLNQTTVDAYVKGEHKRRDVQAWTDLLKRYERQVSEWLPSLKRLIGNRFGRGSPKEEATVFWRRAVAMCGSAAKLTLVLTQEFRATSFRIYRCHQPRPAG